MSAPFQSFRDAKITAGDGGDGRAVGTGGRGGDVGSGNSGFRTQNFTNPDLRTGSGGSGSEFSTGGRGGDIGSDSTMAYLEQDFRDAELRSGADGMLLVDAVVTSGLEIVEESSLADRKTIVVSDSNEST